MTSLFLGGHPALDFLNSAYAPNGDLIETLPDGPSFVRWLAAAGLLDQADAAQVMARQDAAALDRVAAVARALREQMLSWVADWRNGTAIDPEPFLNELLAQGFFVWRVNDVSAVVPQPLLDKPDVLLAIVARQIALFFADEDAALTRPCAGPGCTLVFIDRSKAHRRRFCSAAVCGNRAKVAAFRDRQLTRQPRSAGHR
jgi:predicted RNA-binding Zn ribbon-like protein